MDDFEADKVVVGLFVVGESAESTVEGRGNVGFSGRAEQKGLFEDYLIEVFKEVFKFSLDDHDSLLVVLDLIDKILPCQLHPYNNI